MNIFSKHWRSVFVDLQYWPQVNALANLLKWGHYKMKLYHKIWNIKGKAATSVSEHFQKLHRHLVWQLQQLSLSHLVNRRIWVTRTRNARLFFFFFLKTEDLFPWSIPRKKYFKVAAFQQLSADLFHSCVVSEVNWVRILSHQQSPTKVLHYFSRGF